MAKKEDLARRAWVLLMKLHEAQGGAFDAEAARLGLSQVSAYALHVLSEMPAGPLSQLAAKLSVDPGWVTDIVDRLEEYGAVVRRQSEEDRRVRMVELTPAGRRIAAEIKDLGSMVPPQLFELRESELRSLLRIAERLQKIADKDATSDLRDAMREQLRSEVRERVARSIGHARGHIARPRPPRPRGGLG